MIEPTAVPVAGPSRTALRSFVRRALHVPDDVEDPQLTVLLAVALALLIEEYDLAMLTSALKFIAADLAMDVRELPEYLAWIRVGALPAFILVPFADRVGRRRVFLVSLLATGLSTFFSAFARNSTEFVVLQMITRTFFVSGSAMAFVFVSEEFPANRRGLGLGLLGALAATGHGLGAALFALIEHLPYGWRALYAFGALPVLLFPYFLRVIPETRRFQLQANGSGDVGMLSFIEPLGELWRQSPARAAGIAIAGFMPAFGIICAFQFSGYFVMTLHGFSPQEYAAMVIAGGGIGIVGNVVAGRLGDRFGRRVVGAVLLASFPVFVGIFYRGPSWMLTPAWIAFVFSSQGGRVILRALATELFPTAYRGAATGVFTVLEVLGAAVGLFVLGWLIRGSEGVAPATVPIVDLAAAIPYVATGTVVGALIVLLFPETTQRELEEISG